MFFQNPFEVLQEWLNANLFPLMIAIAALVIGFIIYLLFKRQVSFLVKKEKLEQNTGKNLLRMVRLAIYLIVFTAIIMQFAESLGFITALFTLVGGTIIGFAAMNTLGNVIAGLIVMVSKPFNVGDRILYNGKMVDVIDIKLIYTEMKDLDGVEIHVPNQKLLTEEIVNFRKKGNIVRRNVKVTPGFDEDSMKVENALLEAARKVPKVLKKPEPYVWIHRFFDYAVEYTLFVFINDITQLPEIDSQLHKAVLATCKEHAIDISTPLLLRNVST